MATFIPDKISSGALGLKIKNVLKTLDDDYVIRRIVNGTGTLEQAIFIQRRKDRAWMCLLINDSPFNQINPESLFEDDYKKSFKGKLDSLKNSSGLPAKHLILMSKCSPIEASKLQQYYEPSGGTAFVSKDDFFEHGPLMVQNFLRQLTPGQEQELFEHFFPERRIMTGVERRDFFSSDQPVPIYLDPQQEWAAKLDLETPAEHEKIVQDVSIRLINGVAGSGKTVIALSRALMLAERYPNQKILLLIHNTPITADLRYRLIRDKGGLPDNLIINTYFAWLRKQWMSSLGSRFSPLYPSDIEGYFKDLPSTEKENVKLSPKDLVDECDYINANLIEDQEQYLEWKRTGQGSALQRDERSVVWKLRQDLRDRLKTAKQRMWSDLPYEVCLEGDHTKLETFNHILIDEAQFFAPSWFRSIQLSLTPQASLFLCADPNQGFMKHRLSWKQVGLNVVGRTKKLQHCYRSSREIMSAANKMLTILGPQDHDDYLQPEYDLMQSGPKPILAEAGRAPQDALTCLRRYVKELITKDKCRLYDILIIHGGVIPRKIIYKELAALLDKDSIWDLNHKSSKNEPPKGAEHDYIRIASVDSATGLEARLVFLLGFENLWGRLASTESQNDQSNSEVDREEAIRKMYMAMTRASSQLVLITYEQVPPAIKEIFISHSE